jgi:alpha/beta superfamily hydrolase
MTSSRSQITIPGPAGSLETLLEMPTNDGARAFGVVCHPHPLHGGAMTNKVVHTIARAFMELGLPTARFNFRGVGASTGHYADGVGETEDAMAVIRWMREKFPGRTLWLGGFSFGGAVAIRAAVAERADVLVTVAPAVDRIAGTDVLLPTCPWLILQGGQDDLVPIAQTRAWANSLSKPPRVVELADADHFFHGRLTELRQQLLHWVAESKLA